jgi:homocysteine S-methyltransferase
MPKYRDRLPQLSGRLFLTDGGLETTLIFHEGVELQHFTSFDLLENDGRRRAYPRLLRTPHSRSQKK